MDADYTLKNARKRLANLKQTIEGGEYFEIDTATFDPHPRKPGWLRHDVPNPLKYISPEVGAIAAELRAVLDQTIHAAIVARGPLLPKQRPQFPICQCPKNFRARIRQDLKGLSIPQVAFIGKLQPYRGHHWLAELKGLADAHKHRANIFLRAPEGVLIHGRSLHTEASAEHFHVLPASGVHVPKSVQVNARFKGKVTLEDGRPVIEVLDILQAQISSLLDLLKARFGLT